MWPTISTNLLVNQAYSLFLHHIQELKLWNWAVLLLAYHVCHCKPLLYNNALGAHCQVSQSALVAKKELVRTVKFGDHPKKYISTPVNLYV